MAACKLRQGTGHCSFNARPGPVKLTLEATSGTVQFEKARYNDVDLPGLPADTIGFTIVPGTTDLEIVYLFSDTVAGEAVLKEVCATANPLRQVTASEPSVIYHICAEEQR